MLSIVSFRGRTGRYEWWVTNVITSIASQVASIFGFIALLSEDRPHHIAEAVGLFLIAVLAIEVYLAMTAKRLRDRGRSPWLTLTIFVPYLGWLYLLIECGLLPAHDRPGPKKLVRRQVTKPQN